jgi:hypothetical protein
MDGIEQEILSEIEHAPTHVGVQGVEDVRARWIGQKVYSDLRSSLLPNSQFGRPMSSPSTLRSRCENMFGC